jgi:hypothetical protein
MTPKEKANELIAKFNNELIADTYVIYQNVDESKRCALIAVDEIIKTFDCTTPQSIEYWQEVKTEIQKL